MTDNNLEINAAENQLKIVVDSKVFDSSQVLMACNEFTEEAWIVVNTDEEANVVVKMIFREEMSEEELRKTGLDFQTSLVSNYVELTRES